MNSFKPMLASDYDETKLKFPVIAQPKIDGVRALCKDGLLTGRSLKTHRNAYITAQFSQALFEGFDGEMAAAEETDPALCRKTTSALSRAEGEPSIVWWLFDWAKLEFLENGTSYLGRLTALEAFVNSFIPYAQQAHIEVVPWQLIYNLEDLLSFDRAMLAVGYEGTIIRDPEGKYKQGRSTVKEGGLLRIKRFSEDEAIVKSLVEAEANNNVAKTNALGHTERSSHQANKSAKGMIGNLQCTFIATGQDFTCGPGALTHDERIHYWNNPGQIVGKIIKAKHFPKGVKDLPRFPTFVSFRMSSDIS